MKLPGYCTLFHFSQPILGHGLCHAYALHNEEKLTKEAARIICDVIQFTGSRFKANILLFTRKIALDKSVQFSLQ